MEFIELIKEYVDTIILALSGISITVILTYITTWIIKHSKEVIALVVMPFLKKSKEDIGNELKPYEKGLDLVFEYMSHDAKVKSKNATLGEYDKEKYEHYSNEFDKLAKIEIVTTVLDKVEDVIDDVKLDVNTFINRKGTK